MVAATERTNRKTSNLNGRKIAIAAGLFFLEREILLLLAISTQSGCLYMCRAVTNQRAGEKQNSVVGFSLYKVTNLP